MKYVVCHSCHKALEIGGEPMEIESLLGSLTSFSCVTPLCRGRMVVTTPFKIPPGYKLQGPVPVRVFFRGINGFGSGPGDPASLKRLRELLLKERIVDIRAEPIGQPERVILREIILESGTRLHLETSARGACVYYIEEPGQTCREVVEHELSADSNPEGGDTNREEAGRAPEDQREDPVREVPHCGVCHPASTAQLPDPGGVPSVSKTGGVLSGNGAGGVSTCSDPGLRV